MTSINTLASNIQNLRQGENLTQQQLVEKAKISYSTLAKIERGAIKSPSVFTIKKIAFVLGVTVDTLLESVQPNLKESEDKE